MINERFIELLKKSELIKPLALEELINLHQDNQLKLLQDIIEKSLIDKDTATDLWGKAIGIAYVDPLLVAVSCYKDEMLPHEIAKKANAICLYKINNVISVAMGDPTNISLVRSIEKILGIPVSPLFSFPHEIDAAIAIYYSQSKSFNDALTEVLDKSLDLRKLSDSKADAMSLVRSTSLIELFNSIVYHAFQERASDIHIEAGQNNSLLRIRIDGMMRNVIEIPSLIHQALIIRLKVVSDLNIVQKRLPQDGRFSMNIGDYVSNFRVSTLPGLHGERAVIRILGVTGKKDFLELDNMWFAKSTRKRIERILSTPNGVFIVTGPTGSGKTTTLYSALNFLNSPIRNILTIEDPVEYQLDGVSHIQVRSEIDLTFAKILRSVLRQDPDVILVGEIRDKETAQIAIESALTGHFVLTTLHTNNAVQAVIRLTEIGVEPHMVAPSLVGVLAQRLVGKICDQCKMIYHPEQETLLKYFTDIGSGLVTFYRGKGCAACGNTGYRGRVPVHELIEISEAMRTIISASGKQSELETEARNIGFKSMRYDALAKAILGETTIDETERMTVPEYSE